MNDSFKVLRNGTKIWMVNGILHRTDGPAYELKSGTKWWYQNGKLHRIGGPAFEHYTGKLKWYINDVEYGTKSAYYQELIKQNLISREEAVMELL